MIINIVREPTVPVQPAIREVHITLTPEEALKLKRLVGNLAGDGASMRLVPPPTDRVAILPGTLILIHSMWTTLTDSGI